MIEWRTPSRCSLGDCCAVTFTRDEVGFADTKNPNQAALWFTYAEWGYFIAAVKRGEFDGPTAEVPSGC